ncbi:YVTN family beta-propeller repeat-containing protein [Rikenella microfusus]|uniref:YVTN family beta-propeller repeat-containing protein n=1 Tax=Rikenella microfusus TaxID=28139 RepID=UPI001DDA5B12|nr:YVTN family beta-propeller repeat-containing protein [Rikenella microfusus]HJE89022.1 YVTN family beta-propeller repeat-containing protein [Rikenella microfusus]
MIPAAHAALAGTSQTAPAAAENAPLFTTDITVLSDGRIVTSNKGNKSVRIYAPDNLAAPVKEWIFEQTPTGVAAGTSGGSEKIYVTTFEKRGTLDVIDLTSSRVERSIPVGSGATSPLVSQDGTKVYVLNQFANTVAEVDPEGGVVLRTVQVLREPKGAVVSKDGKYLFVTNFLPAQRADLDYVAADVSVIDLGSFEKIKDIKLANGSNALRGIALSPDGKYVLISHNMGRFAVPTSQLQQGWMNTSALSVVDAEKLTFEGGIVLDEPEHGAAGIWDIKSVGDKVYVTHSGTHDLSVIDYPAMAAKLRSYTGTKEQLSYDLRFMYGIRERVKLTGNGPRKMAVSKDGKQLYIPTYFSDTLNVFDLSGNTVGAAVAQVENRKETDVQAGERIFNDAAYCFQNWQSCNGCHPGDARTDGMNWDLMNDGIGNPKNCKSLLYSHFTPPCMISGIRADAAIADRKGFTHIQFYNIPEEMALKVDAYVKSLKAVPSPYLVGGQLSEKAKQGKKVYEKLKCDECHNGEYYTDMQMHRIGEDIEFEKGWDTPTLREVWRTAPYLFDGRAATMKEVFEVHRHGIEDKKVSAKDIDALVEYVNSL